MWDKIGTPLVSKSKSRIAFILNLQIIFFKIQESCESEGFNYPLKHQIYPI